jgi:2-dehydropantoate 2-reductase
MRVIVYGAGAVGSVIGGRLRQGGADVVLIGRPAHVEAIQANGLALRTAKQTDVVNVAAVTSIAELTPQANDVVLITAKTQDTPAIHDAIESWNPDAAIVCGTNGVEHERLALRRFANVYAMVIQLPAEFEKPGEVTALCAPTNAILDVGRYPFGVDHVTDELAALIESSPNLSSISDPNIMAKKHAKLLLNLGNIAEGACGFEGRFAKVVVAAAEEAKRAYDAAGIPFRLDEPERSAYAARRELMQFDFPEGDTFLGGSTWQSLMKGAPTLESDYFSGQIVLLGRLHSVPTPANMFLQQLARRLMQKEIAVASMSAEQLDSEWQIASQSLA